MTLKISCIKLIREDIRHRGWAAALSCIVLLLMMPVYSMMHRPKKPATIRKKSAAGSRSCERGAKMGHA